MSEQSTGARDEGLRLLQNGDVEGAIAQFQQALAQNPGDARAHGLLGVCHARRGETETAIQSMQEAARLQPNDASAHYNLGLILFQAERLPEAKAELDKALAIDPDNARAKELASRIGDQGAVGTGLGGGLADPAQAAPPAWGQPAPASPPAWGQPAPESPPPFSAAPVSQGAPAWSPAPPMAPPAFAAPGMAGSVTAVHGPQGMQFNPAAAAIARAEAPAAGRRVVRGLLWGAAWGQWWTLLYIIWAFIWGQGSASATFILAVIIFAFAYAFFGSLAGLIMGLANAEIGAGAMIGIGAGLCCLGFEFLMSGGNAASLINIVFYVVTGRYIGARIARQVQAPVPAPALRG